MGRAVSQADLSAATSQPGHIPRPRLPQTSGFLLGHGEVPSPSPRLTHPSLQPRVPPRPGVQGMGHSPLQRVLAPWGAVQQYREGRLGALRDWDLRNKSWGMVVPVGPPEMGPGPTFQDRSPRRGQLGRIFS